MDGGGCAEFLFASSLMSQVDWCELAARVRMQRRFFILGHFAGGTCTHDKAHVFHPEAPLLLAHARTTKPTFSIPKPLCIVPFGGTRAQEMPRPWRR